MIVDEIKIGGYQILTLLLLSINCIIVGMSHALSIFYKYKPEFHCQDDVINGTSSCSSTSCTFEEANRTSVTSEWLLICEREPLIRSSTDVYIGGMLVGGVVAGFLIDRIGRMPILAICLYAQGTLAVALSIVKHYELFLVFRGLQGFFMQGLETSSCILGIELFPSKYRALVSLIMLSTRTIGFIALTGLNYLILDWRILQLVVSVPTTLTVLYIWLIPESARWLLSRGRTIDAEMIIERIANYNNLLARLKLGDKKTSEKPKGKLSAANNDESDVEKSSIDEEAENLLERTANIEVKTAEEGKSNLDADEIAKASMTDEITTLDEKDEPNDLASKETLPNDDVDDKSNENECLRSILRFVQAKFIGRTCLILVCAWFSCSVAFHALISQSARMKIDRHASLAIAGAMELATFLFSYLLISSRCGRRTTLSVAQTIAAIICVLMAISSLTSFEQTEFIAHGKVAILKIGLVANVVCFFVLRIFTIELFPTVSRGTGVGLCVSAEMLGGLVTPLILTLNNYATETKLDVARIPLGLFCICVACLTLLLSETRQLDTLLDSVHDAKMLRLKSNNEEANNEQSQNPEKLRKKLFSEDWVDAGNGIIVNFTENKIAD